jgi:asparagine synthase (glutamine-hydrolysing)
VNVVDDWFNDSATGKISELLLDGNSLMYSVLKPAPVKKLLDDHQSHRQDNHKILFSLVMFEQWLRGVCSSV